MGGFFEVSDFRIYFCRTIALSAKQGRRQQSAGGTLNGGKNHEGIEQDWTAHGSGWGNDWPGGLRIAIRHIIKQQNVDSVVRSGDSRYCG